MQENTDFSKKILIQIFPNLTLNICLEPNSIQTLTKCINAINSTIDDVCNKNLLLKNLLYYRIHILLQMIA